MGQLSSEIKKKKALYHLNIENQWKTKKKWKDKVQTKSKLFNLGITRGNRLRKVRILWYLKIAVQDNTKLIKTNQKLGQETGLWAMHHRVGQTKNDL